MKVQHKWTHNHSKYKSLLFAAIGVRYAQTVKKYSSPLLVDHINAFVESLFILKFLNT